MGVDWRGRHGLAAVVAAAGLLATSGAVPATAQPVPLASTGCKGLVASIPVEADKVRPLVPDGAAPPFVVATSVTDPGTAFLEVLVGKCDTVQVGGVTAREVKEAALRVRLEARPTQDGILRDPSWYQLWVASDNRDLVQFFRDQGGMSSRQAVVVENLAFNVDQTGEFSSFEAPPPTPSPFRITKGRIGPLVAPFVALDGAWTAVPGRGGYMEMQERVIAAGVGPASGTVVPAAGSQMACLFGERDRFTFNSIDDASNGFDVDNSIALQIVNQQLEPPGPRPCPE